MAIQEQGAAMRIGEVARKLNLSTSAIRYYEKQGLIASPDRVSGKREFNNNTVARLRFIQMCQAAGFSISEIRELLTRYAEDSSRNGPWLPAVEVKRNEIRRQIGKLQQTEALLDELVKCRCQSIEQCVGMALNEDS